MALSEAVNGIDDAVRRCATLFVLGRWWVRMSVGLARCP